jgi:hypothetical protein
VPGEAETLQQDATLQAVGGADFAAQRSQMRSHRRGGEAKALTDLFVDHPLAVELHYLMLALGQTRRSG